MPPRRATSATRRRAAKKTTCAWTNDVADVLNTIALSTDRAAGAGHCRARSADGRCLGRSRISVTGWMTFARSSRCSIRQSRHCGPWAVEIPSSWRSSRWPSPPEIEPVLGMPNGSRAGRPDAASGHRSRQPASERMALLHAALALISEAGAFTVCRRCLDLSRRCRTCDSRANSPSTSDTPISRADPSIRQPARRPVRIARQSSALP